jgi:hypothetical protein
MDPRHRDRIAFVRVVSGKFERDMTVTHVPHRQDRPPVERRQALRPRARDRGRGLSRRRGRHRRQGHVRHRRHADRGPRRSSTTRFPASRPECFAYLWRTRPLRLQALPQGLDQLLQEGVVQRYELPDATRRPRCSGRWARCSSRSSSTASKASTGGRPLEIHPMARPGCRDPRGHDPTRRAPRHGLPATTRPPLFGRMEPASLPEPTPVRDARRTAVCEFGVVSSGLWGVGHPARLSRPDTG